MVVNILSCYVSPFAFSFLSEIIGNKGDVELLAEVVEAVRGSSKPSYSETATVGKSQVNHPPFIEENSRQAGLRQGQQAEVGIGIPSWNYLKCWGKIVS